MSHWRPLLVACVLLAVWQAIVWVTDVPPYILPGPARVALALVDRHELIIRHAGITLAEILLGIVVGTTVGASVAASMAFWRGLAPWLQPVLVASQAIPVFALAPLLVLWLGYGMASKVAMAALIIFFPVATTFHDGLRRTDPLLVEAGRMLGLAGWALVRRVRIPAALPAFASGFRVAVAVAPIGAVVGEWVGSSGGLGYLMLHANARVQVDLMFAALLTLAVMAITLHTITDRLLRRAMPWQAGEGDEPAAPSPSRFPIPGANR